MPRSSMQMPFRMGDLLASHPDAASLLSEASHRQALADESAKAARESARAMLMARRRWDDLRHRLDPRGRRLVNVRTGLAALVVIGACLFMLDLLVLGDVRGTATALPLAMCATTTWLMAAWRGALAGREGQRRLRVLITAGTAALILLYVLVHMLASVPRHAIRWHHVAAGAVAMVLIGALTAGVSALIFRIEPADVAAARASWRRAKKRHRTALRQERQDAEAASVAKVAWLDLVRAQTTSVQARASSGQAGTSAEETLAEALQALGRPAEDPGQGPRP